MIGLFFGSAVIMLILGVPIAVTVGFSSIIFILASGIQPVIVIQRLFMGIDSVALMAIPMFILAGDIMNRGGLARRLVNLANNLVGNTSGGLAIVAILGCMFFAAISGSGVATAAAMGAIMVPSMLEQKYDRSYAAAVIASASPIGVIIPPSISFIVYAVLANVSVTNLYKAGIPAGVLMGSALIAVAWLIAKKKGYKGKPKEVHKDVNAKGFMASLGESIWALMTPVIIIGGVFGGIFTATESAVVAVLYSLFVGLFVYRELDIKELPKVILEAGVGTAKIMFIIANAQLFAWVLAYAKIPQMILAGFNTLKLPVFVIFLLINLILLIAGTFMETSAILLITVPIFLPLVTSLGMDPVHFGIIITANTAIGLLTPPFGVCLFTAASVAETKIQTITKAILPFMVAMIAVVLLITYVPQIVMFLI